MSAVASSQSGDVGKDTSGPSRRPNISPGGTVGPANTRDVGTQTDDFTLASFLVYRRGLEAVPPSPLRGTNGRHSPDPTPPSPISISSDEEEESNDTGGLHANPQDVNANALEDNDTDSSDDTDSFAGMDNDYERQKFVIERLLMIQDDYHKRSNDTWHCRSSASP
ncbi:hypothetical protein FAUST_7923 [Fusarium austroamericanum]|uniref:Uncharacterized protein n=1 Tax=Fusarium austroamericanum TaxID=282268 RepID=A0AAN5Z5Q5_FUSAU|nr:hypothetical protein FAUST_7923 [Fusarium austroamericanum]